MAWDTETTRSTPAPTVLLVECSPQFSQRCVAVLPRGILVRSATLATSANQAARLLPFVIVITSELPAAAAAGLAELADAVGATLLSFDHDAPARLDLTHRLSAAIDQVSRRRSPPKPAAPGEVLARVTLSKVKVPRRDPDG